MVTVLIVALAVLVLAFLVLGLPRRRYGRRPRLGRGRFSGRWGRRI
jgi:hypothetical protein